MNNLRNRYVTVSIERQKQKNGKNKKLSNRKNKIVNLTKLASGLEHVNMKYCLQTLPW